MGHLRSLTPSHARASFESRTTVWGEREASQPSPLRSTPAKNHVQACRNRSWSLFRAQDDVPGQLQGEPAPPTRRDAKLGTLLLEPPA